ncbi:MAG: hypothetical protein PHU25_07080 [Deltaproteobacteria bacterium]|nr:hypothetical protein [Deltaproteobacteria bacterium]
MRKQELLFVLVFGSAWGLFEATLGAGLHLARVPLAGTVMASIGFSVLLAALRRGLSPLSLASVSVVAASWKLLDTVVFGVPPLDPMVIRPAIAIASQGLAFTLFFGWNRGWNRSVFLAPRLFVTVAAGMALVRVVSFVVLGQPRLRLPVPLASILLELAITTVGALALFAVIALVSPIHPIVSSSTSEEMIPNKKAN